jgi:ADP-ribose pyrophosphatase
VTDGTDDREGSDGGEQGPDEPDPDPDSDPDQGREQDQGRDRDADDPLAWTTTGSETEYTCPGFAVRRDDVVFPDGRAGEYHSVREPPAVVVLPLTPDGEVVVIEEWRQAVGRVNRGLPAGTMEGDESVRAAARRELREETGHVAGDIEALVTVEPLNGVSNAVHHHVLATDCTPAGDQSLDHNESIRVDTAGYEELLAAVTAGDLRDGRSMTALLYYARTRGAGGGDGSGNATPE